MFNSGLKESNEEEVVLKDVEPTIFKLVLDHIYSGTTAYRRKSVNVPCTISYRKIRHAR